MGLILSNGISDSTDLTRQNKKSGTIKLLMVVKQSGGFTLVELMIVLAISGGLIVIAFSGQASIRQQAKFKDAVEQTVVNLDSIRNEALTSRNDDSSASGADTSKITFGKLVTISPGTSQIVVTDIIGFNPDQISLVGSQTLSTGVSHTINIPWGVTYNGPLLEFAFHRLINGAKLHIYDLGGGVAVSAYPFDENPTSDPTITITLTDSQGRTATVTLDGAHNGTVSRVIN